MAPLQRSAIEAKYAIQAIVEKLNVPSLTNRIKEIYAGQEDNV